MLHFIGLACSSMVTGYVLLEAMGSLYEKKYTNNKVIYVGAYTLYVILSIAVAWIEIPTLNVINSMVILCALTKGLYKAYGKSVLVNSGFIIIYLAIIDIVVTEVLSVFLSSSTYNVLQNSKLFLASGIGNSIIVLCTYKLLIQILERCQINIVSRIQHLYMLFLMVFEFGILCYFVRQEMERENNVSLLLVSLGFVILDAGFIYIYKMLSQEAILEKKTELIEQQLEMTQKYYESLQNNYERMQKIVHDIKKHLQVLEGLEKEGKKEYSTELMDMIGNVQLGFQCSDKIACAVIWNKMQICEQKGIVFEINMQDIMFDFMEKTEITALFANLLDNALEACESSKSNEKRIVLRIHSFKEYIVIRLRNTIGTMPKLKNGKLISTKNGHLGVGMTILESLANKYCGNMDYEYSDTFFETKLILSTYTEKHMQE